jgi:hypothetical protein
MKLILAAGLLGLLPPWTPVEVREQCVGVWGRNFRFGDGPLPAHIESQGHQLLAAPAALHCVVAGESFAWTRAACRLASPARALVTATGESAGLEIRASGWIEADGLSWMSLELKPRQPVTIKRLDLDVPLRADVASLYSQHNVSTRNLANWRSQDKTPERLYWAGALPAAGWRGEFTPQLWLGNTRVGLGWICESPAPWSVGDKDTVLEAVPEAGALHLRAHFVTQPLRLEQPRTIAFGLMPTPVRPPARDASIARVASTGGMKMTDLRKIHLTPNVVTKRTGLDEMAAAGVKTVVLWNNWSDQWGFPAAYNPDHIAFVREFAAAAHQRGLRVLPYCTPMTLLPDTLPDFDSLRRRFNVHPNRSIPRDGHKSYAVELSDEFIEWWTGRMRDFLGQCDVDGFYVDTIQVPDPFNKGPRVAYDVLQRRKLYQRIYALLHGETRKDGLVYLHSSDPPGLASVPYADVHLTGEMLPMLLAYRNLTRERRPFLEATPLALFQAWNAETIIGCPTTWCWKEPSQANYTIGADVEKRRLTREQVLTDAEMFSLSRLFRWPIFSALFHGGKVDPLRTTHAAQWKLEDDFGARDAEWIPVERSTAFVETSPPGVFTSLYLKPGGVLLNVANFAGEDVTTIVRFRPLSGLADRPLAVGRDLDTNGTVAGTGSVKLPLREGSSAIVWLRTAQ